jgi:alkylation response protein AidB-like acyl-CoA dehydrogenase
VRSAATSDEGRSRVQGPRGERHKQSAAVREGLLAAIRHRRPEFEAAGERAEELRTPPPDVVATLREMGVFWLKTPAELGGTPLEPLDFCDVMEELAYADTATAWTVMVGNGGTGTAGGWLPDAGARQVFAPGRPLPLVVGRRGRAVPDGRWPAASW